jgi:hypothetical protein
MMMIDERTDGEVPQVRTRMGQAHTGQTEILPELQAASMGPA